MLVSIQLTETAVAVDWDENADSWDPRLAINALSLFAPEAIEEVAATRQARLSICNQCKRRRGSDVSLQYEVCIKRPN